jgi:hypothetical protein
VGSVALGQLLSRVQATVIRNGNELERMLKEQCPYYSATVRMEDVTKKINEGLIDKENILQVFFAYKHETEGEKSIIGNIIVVDHEDKIVHIVKVKDGDTFDTKKISGELVSLRTLSEALGRNLGYTARYHFCAFNQPDKAAIIFGAKGRLNEETAMTGSELSELIGVDYESIREVRKEDRKDNFDYLIEQMFAIPEVRAKIDLLLTEEQNDRTAN